MRIAVLQEGYMGFLFALALILFPCGASSDALTPPCADRSIIYQPEKNIPGQAPDAALPVMAHAGPHLLLDDYLIADSAHISRVVIQPQRSPAIPNPIVNASQDHCFQPFFSVLRDSETGRFRICYGAWRDDKRMDRSLLATMESEDGIHFIQPHRICETPEIQFGSEVIDRKSLDPNPSARYAYCYWFDGGMRILVSADGFKWRALTDGVVLPHDHDINNISWDPIRQVYAATVSTYIAGEQWSGQRRTTMMSFSHDLLHWEPPWFILAANDALDDGQTQFYAMNGYLARGSLRIGMVKVLRDDLKASDTQPGSFGRAHTSLAWSRDGRSWIRDRSKFFEPDDNPQAWDHAHAWIDEQFIVGDDVYLYYGGYKQGHKMNRFEERQIGLVKMPLDRYAARRAEGDAPGMLKTVPIQLSNPAGTLRLNVNASGGQVRVQALDAKTGKVLHGLSFADCQPIASGGLREEVRWRGDGLANANGQIIQLEFELIRADLYAFEFD
ncbi:MAG: hypothetical protein AB1656_11365 [Candidatus Omnitrophota bacterium]